MLRVRKVPFVAIFTLLHALAFSIGLWNATFQDFNVNAIVNVGMVTVATLFTVTNMAKILRANISVRHHVVGRVGGVISLLGMILDPKGSFQFAIGTLAALQHMPQSFHHVNDNAFFVYEGPLLLEPAIEFIGTCGGYWPVQPPP